MYMKEIGKMIKLKEREYIYIRMDPLIQENGMMINNMDMDRKNGLMEHNIKETS